VRQQEVVQAAQHGGAALRDADNILYNYRDLRCNKFGESRGSKTECGV
jgi:hypothetical protein